MDFLIALALLILSATFIGWALAHLINYDDEYPTARFITSILEPTLAVETIYLFLRIARRLLNL